MNCLLEASSSDPLISATLTSEEQISKFTEKKAFPVHMANAILCLDLHPNRENLTVTGGADNKVLFACKLEYLVSHDSVAPYRL